MTVYPKRGRIKQMSQDELVEMFAAEKPGVLFDPEADYSGVVKTDPAEIRLVREGNTSATQYAYYSMFCL
ncbi:hypothetical protein NW768_009723 [Fusarium equiseti]|uniref:Uncharacterized protein n=1 Tax=Fusarium equiseti TaxID=61235 RepID=A0ABQ8R2K5_FUSEQ|nr:hypothetical protein NW768_009723 [Fusarium equiseti]